MIAAVVVVVIKVVALEVVVVVMFEMILAVLVILTYPVDVFVVLSSISKIRTASNVRTSVDIYLLPWSEFYMPPLLSSVTVVTSSESV